MFLCWKKQSAVYDQNTVRIIDFNYVSSIGNLSNAFNIQWNCLPNDGLNWAFKFSQQPPKLQFSHHSLFHKRQKPNVLQQKLNRNHLKGAKTEPILKSSSWNLSRFFLFCFLALYQSPPGEWNSLGLASWQERTWSSKPLCATNMPARTMNGLAHTWGRHTRNNNK